MVSKQWTAGTAAALALAAMMGAAQSAPIGSIANDLRPVTAAATLLQKAQYRLCVTEGGARQCRRVEIYGPSQFGYQAPGRVYGYQAAGPGMYGYQAPITELGKAYPPTGYGYRPVGEDVPDAYPAGSRPWWESMDKLGRGGHQD